AANVTAPDAAAAAPKTGSRAPGPPRASGRLGPPLPGRPAPSTSAHATGPPSAVPVSLPTAPPPAPAPTGPMELGKKIVAPIKPSLFRRPLGTVVEGPVKLPPKPMPPVAGRPSAAGGAHTPSSPGPLLPAIPDAPPVRRAAVAPGPFAQRMRSLFDDRPEAVERL